MLHRCVSIGCAAFLIVLSLTATARAVTVPEVDPASMSGAMALLAMGGLFVADRIRRTLRAR